MPVETSNALASSSSAYLRSAIHQPVNWQPWGDAAFQRAAAENKAILLDIGAVWCHWCHVMDRESYENAETAALINEHFIAIKVDRDERPDIDTRYQAAVAAISGQGGWPLTAFLTPDGRPYFGGTYFPPEERYGRPSFRRVLFTMADSFYNNRSEVDESAASVMDAIAHNETFIGDPTNLDPAGTALAIAGKLIAAALQGYDPLNGGFGSQPKFPHPAALDMLVDAASRAGANASACGDVALTTLKKMARGGIFDQLAGGFHRYSVDERWVVPHFEKMAYDNAALLATYTHAFQTFPDPEIAEAAHSTLRWMRETLADSEHGGFYSSQDADLSLDDDGNYFTWTRDEAASVLQPGELRLAEAYYDIGTVGDMHHDPARNVLFCPHTLDEAARLAGMPASVAPAVLAEAKAKLLAARQQRPSPFVDKTLYTGWNALCISAFVQAGRVFNKPGTVAFAVKSLDRALTAFQDGTLAHVIAYSTPAEENSGSAESNQSAENSKSVENSDSALNKSLADVSDPERSAPNTRHPERSATYIRHPERSAAESKDLLSAEPQDFPVHASASRHSAQSEAPQTVPAILDDYVFLGHACLDVWEATGEPRFYAAAEALASTLLSRFYDGKGAGFFDTAFNEADQTGALSVRRKPVQDAPTPAGNPAAAALLLRLHALSGNEAYRDNAQETLEAFAAIVEHLGLYAATFGSALVRLGSPAVQVVIIGEGSAAAQMELIALTRYAVNKTVIRLRRDQLHDLPPALAATLPNLSPSDTAIALICTGFTCQPPVTNSNDLLTALTVVES